MHIAKLPVRLPHRNAGRLIGFAAENFQSAPTAFTGSTQRGYDNIISLQGGHQGLTGSGFQLTSIFNLYNKNIVFAVGVNHAPVVFLLIVFAGCRHIEYQITVAGLAVDTIDLSANREVKVVIGRDHLDSGSVASPNRETESMRDGSDAVSDWPLLNALLNTASGATWVSFHHGGGVGMGYAQHAGLVIVCDGSKEADARIARVLWNDPATGVMRHADAGYEEAIACAREHGLNLPMIEGTE